MEIYTTVCGGCGIRQRCVRLWHVYARVVGGGQQVTSPVPCWSKGVVCAASSLSIDEVAMVEAQSGGCSFVRWGARGRLGYHLCWGPWHVLTGRTYTIVIVLNLYYYKIFFTGILICHPCLSQFLSSFAFGNTNLCLNRILISFAFRNIKGVV